MSANENPVGNPGEPQNESDKKAVYRRDLLQSGLTSLTAFALVAGGIPRGASAAVLRRRRVDCGQQISPPAAPVAPDTNCKAPNGSGFAQDNDCGKPIESGGTYTDQDCGWSNSSTAPTAHSDSDCTLIINSIKQYDSQCGRNLGSGIAQGDQTCNQPASTGHHYNDNDCGRPASVGVHADADCAGSGADNSGGTLTAAKGCTQQAQDMTGWESEY